MPKVLQKSTERRKHYVDRLKVNTQGLAASVEYAYQCTDWDSIENCCTRTQLLFLPFLYALRVHELMFYI